jgi:RNA polymerase sigma-70 factor (ECF subfamily)
VRLAVKLVWNRDDAEELVQDAFRLALADGVNAADDRFGPWMWRTVSNLCLNHRRRRRPEPLEEAAQLPAFNRPDARLAEIEELDRLRLAVERLPDQQRLAIVLRTMEQMDYAQIASVMEISESAVRAHVHNARKQLAVLMETQVGGSHASMR